MNDESKDKYIRKEITSLTIKDWAEDERPREKLMNLGAEALSDAELIAIIIGSGNREKTAVGLAREILRDYENNLNLLSKESYENLKNNYKGIGDAKAVNILAALALANRRIGEEDLVLPQIRGASDAYNLLRPDLAGLNHEAFWVILMSNSHKVLGKRRISEGGWTETSVDLKKIFKVALENNAPRIIIAHNHPSGTLRPSDSDRKITKRIVEAGKLLSVKVVDHIIVTKNGYKSLAEEGLC